MNISESRTLPARMDAFPLAAGLIEHVCARAGLPAEDRHRITLIVEELFTNTVMHGHGGDSAAPVTLTLETGPDSIRLVYEDTAPRHDPFATPAAAHTAAPVEARPVGGLGIVLITALASSAHHSYAGGKNRVTLVVPLRRNRGRPQPDGPPA